MNRDFPKGSRPPNSTSLLELWEELRVVERPWRIAVGMMYGGVWIIGGGFAAFVLHLCVWLVVTGGTGAAVRLSNLLFAATIGCVLLGVAVSLLGAVFRPIAARPVTRFCRERRVLELPPEPPPQVAERFGHHRVFMSDQAELLLGQQRAAAVREVLRAVGAGGFLAIVGALQIVFSGWLWRIVSIGTGLASLAAWVWSIASPVPMQWLAISEQGKARLTVEYARLVVFRFTRDVAADELARLRVHEGQLYLDLRDGEVILLATVGFGAAGRWRSRRLGAAFRRIVGGPNRIRFENDQVVERLVR